jgi:hypothetical protein
MSTTAGDDKQQECVADEGREDEEKHILEEWAQQKLALTKITQTMGELAHEALTVQKGSVAQATYCRNNN